MRLIDADALLDALERKRWYEGADELSATVAVVDAPAIDAVPVVRCRDCKWWKTNYSWNGKEHKVCVIEPYEPVRKPDDYCSMGERKDDAVQ